MSGRNGNGNVGLILSVVCSFMVILLVFSIYSGNGRNYFNNVSSLYGTFSNVVSRFSESSKPKLYGCYYTETNAYVSFSYPIKTYVVPGTGNNCGDYVAVFDRAGDDSYSFKALYACSISHSKYNTESAWFDILQLQLKVYSSTMLRKIDISDVEIYAITYDQVSQSFMLNSKYGVTYFNRDPNSAGGR